MAERHPFLPEALYKQRQSELLLGATKNCERQASSARSGALENIGWTAARDDLSYFGKLATAAASLS